MAEFCMKKTCPVKQQFSAHAAFEETPIAKGPLEKWPF
jgi:hypothetical protein